MNQETNTITNYQTVQINQNFQGRRLIRTVAEFINVQTGQIERNVTNYVYVNGAEHRCPICCYDCLYNANISTHIDRGEDLEVMKEENGGDYPVDWFERISESQRMYLEGLMNDEDERRIIRRFYRRRHAELGRGECHANCDTDAE